MLAYNTKKKLHTLNVIHHIHDVGQKSAIDWHDGADVALLMA